ncbi:MAG: hypothetical protein ACO3GP_07855 [Candidatus Limnocylindrus sp.]
MQILHWLSANNGCGNPSEWASNVNRLNRIKAKLVELTGHQPFRI